MVSIRKEFDIHKEITIPILFILGFLGIIGIAGFQDVQNAFSINTISDTTDKFFENVYVKIGFVSIFLYELIPSVFRILSTTGFFIGLLNEGINPFLLVLVSTIGRIFGFYILYMLGRLLYRIFKNKDREMADADHLLHKHRLTIFFITPFLGVLGDIVVVVAGHERLGFLKILPFLILSSILKNAIWLYATIGQIQVVSG